jgi:hypothetical protein
MARRVLIDASALRHGKDGRREMMMMMMMMMGG